MVNYNYTINRVTIALINKNLFRFNYLLNLPHKFYIFYVNFENFHRNQINFY
jgi:hypothetical protein